MRVWVGGMYVLALWRSGGGRALGGRERAGRTW